MPRSPVSAQTRSSSAAEPASASKNASLMRPAAPRALGQQQRRAGRACSDSVVATSVVLHEAHAVALDGAGDDRVGRPGCDGQGAAQGLVVVAVDLGDRQPNASSFAGSGSRSSTSPRRAEALEAVGVDDRRQVGEPQVAGERDRLPDRALVQLAVADQADRCAGRCRSWRSASAMPMAIAGPWPSDPPVISTPGEPRSGCPAKAPAVAAVARDARRPGRARRPAPARRTAPAAAWPLREQEAGPSRPQHAGRRARPAGRRSRASCRCGQLPRGERRLERPGGAPRRRLGASAAHGSRPPSSARPRPSRGGRVGAARGDRPTPPRRVAASHSERRQLDVADGVRALPEAVVAVDRAARRRRPAAPAARARARRPGRASSRSSTRASKTKKPPEISALARRLLGEARDRVAVVDELAEARRAAGRR